MLSLGHNESTHSSLVIPDPGSWVLSAPDGPHAGPMSLAIRDDMEFWILVINDLDNDPVPNQHWDNFVFRIAWPKIT